MFRWMLGIGWLLVSAQCVVHGMEIVEKGNPKATIVLDENATAVSKIAAKDLRRIVEKSTGASLPVTNNADQVPDGMGKIFVGQRTAAANGISLPKFSPEEFLIRINDNTIVLAGDDSEGNPLSPSTQAGTWSAVSSFLGKYLGVRWLWPGPTGEVIPKQASLTIPKGEIVEKPSFFWRDLWLGFQNNRLGHEEFNIWKKRNLMGKQLSGDCRHSFSTHLRNVKFKEHPECFAMIDGKRRPLAGSKGQICTSNPGVIEIVTTNIIKSKNKIASISPNDGGGFCECPACLALDGKVKVIKYQDPELSDRIFTFADEIGKRLEKEAPGKYAGIFAYTYYRDPPKRLRKLSPNVVVAYTHGCHWSRTSANRKKYKKNIKKWGEIADKIILREYYGLGYWLDLPNIHTRLIAEDIQFINKNNVIGVYSEMGRNFSTHGPNYYLVAKLLWNVSADPADILNDYYKTGFGPAAKEIQDYFDLFENRLAEKAIHGEGAGCIDTLQVLPELFDAETVAKAGKHIEKAYELAGNDQDIRKRLDFIKIGYDYTKNLSRLLFLGRRLCGAGVGFFWFKPYPGAENASDAQLAAWIKEAITLIEERTKLLEETKYLPALNYVAHTHPMGEERSIGGSPDKVIKQLKDALTFRESDHIRLGDPWKFSLDEERIGENERWFATEYNDDDWKEIGTGTVWENQGYTYNGEAWYRLKFKIPKDKQGQRAVIRFGAIDESYKLWVNGKLVAEFTFDPVKDKSSWKKPKIHDITSFLKFGEENLVAVKVIDKAGLGGIWKGVTLGWLKDSNDMTKE